MYQVTFNDGKTAIIDEIGMRENFRIRNGFDARGTTLQVGDLAARACKDCERITYSAFECSGIHRLTVVTSITKLE